MTGSLDKIFVAEVLEPWARSCETEEFPWRATPELRRSWLAMTTSPYLEEALCGAVALARTSSLAEEEREAVEEFFNRKEALCGNPPDLLSSMLLSGASPPHLFLQSFISLAFADHSHPLLWDLFSRYLRHPSSAGFSRQSMFPPPEQPRVSFLLNANPLREVEAERLGVWGICQRQFKGPRRRPAPAAPEPALAAHALRSDWGASELREWIRTACLPRPIEESLTAHPCLARPCPVIDHRDPSSHAISFFSGPDPVSRVWRFYSPLLIKPWLMDPSAAASDLERLGTLMLGALPPPPSQSQSAVPFMELHPLRAVAP